MLSGICFSPLLLFQASLFLSTKLGRTLLSKMSEVGNQYGKSNTQVALNWLLRQGNVVPIPGAKSAAQAEEFAGALGWSLGEDDERELHNLARKVKPAIGFLAESF